MKEISIVINARLSSSRVPNKLLRPFANTTLFEIALRKISNIKFARNIYAGLGDSELIKIAQNYPKVKVLRRDSAATSKGTHPQVVTFAHYRYVESDYIFIINPCQPLLSIKTIENAFQVFQSTDFTSYTAAVPTGDWIFDAEGNPVTNKDKTNVTTNKDITFLKASHSFHIIQRDTFLRNGFHWKFEKRDPALILVPKDEIYDVDEENEFLITEFMYKKKHNL